jgi:hypothetical protein
MTKTIKAVVERMSLWRQVVVLGWVKKDARSAVWDKGNVK